MADTDYRRLRAWRQVGDIERDLEDFMTEIVIPRVCWGMWIDDVVIGSTLFFFVAWLLLSRPFRALLRVRRADCGWRRWWVKEANQDTNCFHNDDNCFTPWLPHDAIHF